MQPLAILPIACNAQVRRRALQVTRHRAGGKVPLAKEMRVGVKHLGGQIGRNMPLHKSGVVRCEFPSSHEFARLLACLAQLGHGEIGCAVLEENRRLTHPHLCSQPQNLGGMRHRQPHTAVRVGKDQVAGTHT